MWLGAATDRDRRAGMLGRSLGGRDIALAAGTLLALADGDPAAVRRWARAGAVADAIDAIGTVACWSSLPRVNRIVSVAASATAAVLGTIPLRDK